MGGGDGRPTIVVVVGPTAVGKSECALLICERFAGEIVSVDSMQVYRGFDRATAKPGPPELARAPHHGIDLVDPGQDYSMGDFVRQAETAIGEIVARRRLPVLVGGTGLYLRALLRGMADAPGRAPRLRRRLNALGEKHGVPWLHRMLRRVDPDTAARLPSNDRQRIVRALEVFFAAKRPLSHLIGKAPFGAARYDTVTIGLSCDRAELYRRIDARVGAFFAAGLVEEVRGLLAAGWPETANAFKALGYKEVLAHLRGACSLDEAIALTRRNTRRYAKRQLTWFHREPDMAWFDVDPAQPHSFQAPLEHVARQLALRQGVAWA